jgi:hypothetical protein
VAPRKQRHTARRIWQRLIVEEEDARIGESTVRNLVARLRIEIGAGRCQVMVPQTHPPAAEAEVDFGEFAASVAGQTIKLYMFWSNLRGTCPSQRGLLLILTSGTKINSCDPPLTAVCTAYATPPFPLFSHPQSSRPAFDQVAVSTWIGGSTSWRSASPYWLGSRSISD